ncbi:MAG: carbon-nitrogen hydrolase family protein [Promethearchaeota archaeon]|nr:MAG: carbon-nitrogen hydrolase family protein [Candidatus Lokiarchaeota archaeon]
MRVACIQPELFEQRKDCYYEIERILNEILEIHNNCEVICLPERWVPFFRDPTKNFQEERGNDYFFIKNLAKEYTIKFLSGAIWEKRTSSEKPAITCYFFNENGEEIGRQDKIHLYAYEREHFEPGKELKVFNLDRSRYFTILICFDMAFIDTPRLAVESGADLLFSPTQIRDDGMDNWEIYLKARALENRIPIVACNTFGNYKKRNFLGNSKIISFYKGSISPSKLKIVEGPKGSSGFIFDNIDLNFPKKLREIRFKEKIDKNDIEVKVIKT